MSDRRDRKPWPDFDAESFVGDVLGRTSGSACERASARLGDLMADRLTGLDRQLVQAHLEHCPRCRELAVTEGWLAALLPRMAEVEPGPEFLATVLQRTTAVGRTAVGVAAPTGPAGWMDRLGRWWERQIVRPQFAVQAAYVATVLLVLVTYTPGSPLRQVPQKALTVITAGPEATPVIGPAMVRVGDWVDGQGAEVADVGRSQVRNYWQRFNDSLVRRADRSRGSRTELGRHWQNMLAMARARELGGVGYELLAVVRSSQEVWWQWWQTEKSQSGS